MGIRTRARSALDDVSDTASRIGNAAEWQTYAFVAVAAVSVAALLVATLALASKWQDPIG